MLSAEKQTIFGQKSTRKMFGESVIRDSKMNWGNRHHVCYELGYFHRQCCIFWWTRFSTSSVQHESDNCRTKSGASVSRHFVLKIKIKDEEKSALLRPQIFNRFYSRGRYFQFPLTLVRKSSRSDKEIRLLIKIEFLILVVNDRHLLVDYFADRFSLLLFIYFLMWWLRSHY